MTGDAISRTGRLVGLGLLVFLCTGYAASRGPAWGEVGVVEAVSSLPSWAIDLLAVVMQLGTVPVILLATAVVVVVAPGDWKRAGVAVIVAGAASWLLSDIAKEIVQRPRPSAFSYELVVHDRATGFGWPSTHTAIATGTLAAAALACGRRPTVALLLATVVGIARIAVGVHLPLDVLGGLALGMAVAAGTTRLVTR